MRTFLFFSTVYGLANLYVFFKLSSVLEAGTAVDIFTGICTVLMALSPVLVHLYSFKGPEKSVRFFARISYIWVAFLVLFSPLALLFELYNFIAVLRTGTNPGLTVLSPSRTFFLPLFLSVALNIYGYFEAKNLRVEKLIIRTPKLPAGVDKITVAQISDLHLSVVSGDGILEKIIREIEKAGPDIIVSTGDLLDGVVSHVDHLAGKLKGLNARWGKFAVIGNHESYGGLKHALKFTEDSGFTLLRDRGVTVEGLINIAGIDDLAEYRNGGKRETRLSEREILSGLPAGKFTLLLKHRTTVDSASLGLFDLQLSGHTHKGQIFPINLLTPFIFYHHAGSKELPKGSVLYVSRGAGTSGPPVRLLSPPELTLIEIVSEKV